MGRPQWLSREMQWHDDCEGGMWVTNAGYPAVVATGCGALAGMHFAYNG